MNVAPLVDYIENNLESPLDLDSIASRFGYSPYYLHRVFTRLAGLPLMSYVRKRKLACSLQLLAHSDLKVIDVAMQYGFDYEQSFIRSFKEEFGMTPNKYRKTGGRMDITPRLTDSDIEYLTSGMLLPPDRVFLRSFKLIGLETFISSKDPEYFEKPNRVALDFLQNHAPLIKGDVNRDVYYAKIHYLDEDLSKSNYMPSFSYTKVESYPDSLSLARIDSCEYVVFRYIGRHSPYEITLHHLREVYNYIYSQFSDYLWSHCDMQNKLERIDETVCRKDYCEMEFLFPLRQTDK